jgi:hypothetical protein
MDMVWGLIWTPAIRLRVDKYLDRRCEVCNVSAIITGHFALLLNGFTASIQVSS